ncbi:MAG: outer membrane lipoprotein-sorting protein, partial [Puniceicoccales bacterium]|nr:outer membrane lipoprotein-sorting protein [Puniceicoccales bacterium]
ANGTDANAGAVGGAPLRLILQSGPAPAIWVLDASGKPVRATGGETQPLFPELIFTPFELQTPFNFWPDARYVETRRVRGRPTHLFQLTPPEDFKRAHPEVGFIKIGIDKAYRAPLQTIIYDAKGKESRKLEAESFARVQQRYYIPEEIRLLDLVSRDKDIFRVKAAALNLRFERNIFDPATLDKAAAQPEEARFEKVE